MVVSPKKSYSTLEEFSYMETKDYKESITTSKEGLLEGSWFKRLLIKLEISLFKH